MSPTDGREPLSAPGPLVGGPAPRQARSRRRLTLGRRIAYGVAAPVTVAVLRTLWRSYRFTLAGSGPVRELGDRGQPFILTMWHDSILVGAWFFDQLARRGVPITYLVSPSMDGELAVAMLRRIDGLVVRGSATRSGVKAMRGLYRAIRQDKACPVVLPDGPNGPRHHCKPGSIMLAQLSGASVVPMACAASAGWELPTWDRMLLPCPWSRVAVVMGEPYTLPRGLTEEELEAERASLERRLEELGAEARELASR